MHLHESRSDLGRTRGSGAAVEVSSGSTPVRRPRHRPFARRLIRRADETGQMGRLPQPMLIGLAAIGFALAFLGFAAIHQI